MYEEKKPEDVYPGSSKPSFSVTEWVASSLYFSQEGLLMFIR